MTKYRVLALSVAFVVLGSGAVLAFYRGPRSTQSDEPRATNAASVSTNAQRSLEKSIVLGSEAVSKSPMTQSRPSKGASRSRSA